MTVVEYSYYNHMVAPCSRAPFFKEMGALGKGAPDGITEDLTAALRRIGVSGTGEQKEVVKGRQGSRRVRSTPR